MSASSLLAPLLPLRLAAFRHLAAFRDTPSGRRAVREHLATQLDRAERTGEVEVLRRAGAPVAFALWAFDEDSWFRTPTTQVTFDLDPGDAQARAWLLERLDAWAPDLDASTDLMMDPRHTALLPDLEARGFGLTSALLVGQVAPALDRLVARYDPPSDLAHLGLTLRPVTTPADVDALVALKRRVFAEVPDHCWFYLNPGFAEAEREGLLADLGGGAYWLVARPDGAVVGTFGASFQLDGVLWGPCAGVDLALDPSVRGQGVVKTAYRLLLEAAAAHGCVAFKGGTSQPAVMHLSRVMGREPHALELRRAPKFPRQHFAPLLGP